jgi:hypothetical protein
LATKAVPRVAAGAKAREEEKVVRSRTDKHQEKFHHLETMMDGSISSTYK